MANSTTPNAVTVMGNLRMECGVLTMADGAAGLAVQSSIQNYVGGTLCAKSAPANTGITFVSGGFKALTALSGNDFQYIVFGT